MSSNLRCGRCGAEAPEGARFCSQCGSRLTADAAPAGSRPDLDTVFAHLRKGEQRPATILMTDVSGYTALGEQADPEWVYHLINEIFSELVECLIAHGAHIDKYMGDEVMALFGVPIAQERSVERAVRAALALRDRLEALNREGRFGSIGLGLHTGINVGPVMVGPVGHREHADYTVIGDAVNVTKRLEEEAPDGQIYVTRAVREAVAELFEFEPIGRLALAGRRQEIEAFRLLAPVETSPLAAPAAVVPLLGREDETRRIAAVGEKAAGGPQAAAYVVGPAGIGKSRLLDEWALSDGARRFRIVRCACHVFGQHFPLLPLAQIAAQLVGLRIEGWPPRVAGDVSLALQRLSVQDSTREQLGRLLGVFGSRQGDGDEDWRQGLVSCFGEVLGHMIDERSLCLLLEDIQWLDEPSSAVLGDLLGEHTDWPVLVLVSSREPVDRPFPEALGAEIVGLTALPLAAMKRLVEAWAAPDLLPESTVQAICERAEGHPYFAHELVYALRRGVGPGVGSVGLPHTLQELFLAQLDWLPLECRGLVQAASVLGEPLSAELLQAAMGPQTPLSAVLLGEATQTGLLRPASVPGQFVFGRRLLFEAAYATIPTSRRREVHSRIASHIIDQSDHLGPGAVHTAAYHAYLGFGDHRAIDLLLESARCYRLGYSNQQAIRDATRATELMSSLEKPEVFVEQRLEALWLLAQSYEVLGDLDRAEGVLAEAEILLDESGNREMVAQIALSSGTLHLMRGELGEAARHYQRARDEWEELGDSTRLAHSLLGMGLCASAGGDRDRAIALFREATKLPDTALWVRAAALNNAGVVLLSEGRYPGAESYLREGLEANQREGDRRGVAHSKASLGELYYRLAWIEEAARWLDEGLEEARQIEDAACVAVLSLVRARVHLSAGELELARGLMEDAPLQAGSDPDTDALIALTQREIALVSGEPVAGLDETGTSSETCRTSAVCLNAEAETLCLTIEAALCSDQTAQVQEATDRLTERLASVTDRHLRRYAEWLLSLAAGEPAAAGGMPPHEEGEWTMFDVRAKRLQDRLRA